LGNLFRPACLLFLKALPSGRLLSVPRFDLPAIYFHLVAGFLDAT